MTRCFLAHGSPFGVNNGNCCAEYDETARMGRKTVLTILKTPYGIGFLIAFILNLIIPEDSGEEPKDEKVTATTEA